MRFAGRVSAANYIQAGRSAASQSSDMINIARTNAPNYQAISEQAITDQAKNYETSQRLHGEVMEAGLRAQASLAENEADIQIRKARQDAKRGVAKGQMISAAGGFLGSYLEKMPKSLAKEFEPTDTTALQNMHSKHKQRAAEARSKYDSIINEEYEIPDHLTPDTATGDGSPSGTVTDDGSPSNTSTSSSLSGNRKILADAIAGPESGSWGYEAFNQGGANNGRTVLGKSGNYKELMGGRSLTDLTLEEIFQKQNMGGSDEAFRAAGGLHAVGRYQFIGRTLQDEVKRMGLDPKTTKFTPKVQDDIFFSHIKRIGNISPWVGPSDQYSAAEKARLRSIIQTL